MHRGSFIKQVFNTGYPSGSILHTQDKRVNKIAKNSWYLMSISRRKRQLTNIVITKICNMLKVELYVKEKNNQAEKRGWKV